MYIFKFTDRRNRPDVTFEGQFPEEYAEKLFEEGVNFIVISTYSRTIKVPKEAKDPSFGDKLDYDEYYY